MRNARPCLVSAASGTALLAALMPVAAVAQTEAREDQIEDIIVEARRTAENLQDVPLAVSAVTAQEMAKAQVITVQDLRRVAPGLTTGVSVRSPDNVVFNIRGQSQADMLLTTDPSVGVYVDGIYIPRTNGLKMALFDIERVEVLKGPQGTLYGKNTTGGAVSLYTVAPRLMDTGGFAELAYGSWQSFNARGALNLPLGDSAAIRLSGQYDSSGGYAENAVGRPVTDREAYSLRGQLRVDPTDNFSARAAVSYSKYTGSGQLILVTDFTPGGISATDIAQQLGVPVATGNAILGRDRDDGVFFKSNSTMPTFNDYEGWDASLTLQWDLPFATIKSLTGYRSFERTTQEDYDGSSVDSWWNIAGTTDDFFSQELNFSGDLIDNRLRWVLGVYYAWEQGTQYQSTILRPTVNAFYNWIDNDVGHNTWGVYGQIDVDITDRLAFTGGLRWTQEDQSYVTRARLERFNGTVTCNIPAVDLVDPAVCSADYGKVEFSKNSYSLALRYKLTDRINAYVTTRRGFRGGGFNNGSTVPGSYAPFEPEIATDYEIGLKSDLFDRHVRLNIAAYQTNYENIQRTALTALPSGGAATIVANAAEATIRGVEVDLRAILSSNFEIGGNLSHVDAKYDQFVTRSATGTILQDRTSEPFGVSPFSYTLSAEYRQGVGPGTLAARIEYYHADEFGQSGPARPSLINSAYNLINGSLTYNLREQDMQISFEVRNLLNKEYFVALVDGRAPAGIVLGMPAEPRYIGVRLLKRWGGD